MDLLNQAAAATSKLVRGVPDVATAEQALQAAKAEKDTLVQKATADADAVIAAAQEKLEAAKEAAKPPPPSNASTNVDGVTGGRRKKTRRGGKKTKKSRRSRK